MQPRRVRGLRKTALLFATLVATLAGAGLAGPVPGAMAAALSNGGDDVQPLFDCGSYDANQQLTREQIRQRAQSWVDASVPYSQSSCYSNQYGSYRQDCSGFVSMAWGLTNSRTTRDFDPVSHAIARADLLPGDALIKPDVHMALFVGWADAAHTQPIVQEETEPGSWAKQDTWSASYASGFTPIRYDNVIESSRYQNLGVYRTSESKFIIRAANGSILTQVPFGDTTKGDIPVVGHFENSAYDNLAVYRASESKFIIRAANGSILTQVPFGDTTKGDVPVVGHFENSAYDNLAVYRKSTGTFIIRAANGSVLTQVPFGDTGKGDIPVVGHFENSAYDNLAVYRASENKFIIRAANGSILTQVPFGDTTKGDIPVVGHFENSAYDNLAVYRKSENKFIIRAANGSILTQVAFGDTTKGDIPIVGYFQ
ncbi:hypothetical protein [Nonomuraea guangzhouensis]|uniref:Uncharacterized protein n=1 Tax=Nonomuraea guangzhouensis TaxID=1291555 RepID=A0ABW4H0J3_9ACTN|nr:hypothetical protein [Nonomuraea guangzhouensis]